VRDVRRRRAGGRTGPRAGTRSRRAATAAAVVASVVALVGTPVVVLLLASSDTVTAEAPPIRPGSRDALRPATPFFRNAGDGIRPDGIGCTGADGRILRGRAHLDVFADGRRVTVPAGIGVQPTCAYWLGTSRDDGIVAIASPERRAFTLGDLFDIWGAPLTRSQVLAFDVGPDRPVRVYVNGRRAAGNPRAVRIVNGREIALVIGRAPARVPSRFAFPPGG
jgi:hypothetical protein